MLRGPRTIEGRELAIYNELIAVGRECLHR
jgi:hypothetical protein